MTAGVTAGVTAGAGARSRQFPARLLARPAWGVLAVLLAALAWEGYKAVGSAEGWSVGETRVLPRADDDSMPHLTEILARFGRPELGIAGSASVAQAVVSAAWFSLRLAGLGWLAGAVIGIALAVLMQRFRTAQDALVPYVVVSQTVPLVALAPLVVGWGGHLAVLGRPWEPWMSVAAISSYLAFFPVTMGTLRGLASPAATQLDLMRSYGAGRVATLRRLRFPASVPYLLPALRLAAASSVVGAIVAEISTGTRGGLGRMIIEYAQSATGDPAKPWTAILGAAVLGLVVSALVGLLDLPLRRYLTGGAR